MNSPRLDRRVIRLTQPAFGNPDRGYRTDAGYQNHYTVVSIPSRRVKQMTLTSVLGAAVCVAVLTAVMPMASGTCRGRSMFFAVISLVRVSVTTALTIFEWKYRDCVYRQQPRAHFGVLHQIVGSSGVIL